MRMSNWNIAEDSSTKVTNLETSNALSEAPKIGLGLINRMTIDFFEKGRLIFLLTNIVIDY